MGLTLVLLSSNEDALTLRQILTAHGRDLLVRHAVDLPGLRALVADLGPASRLVSYLSNVIVPADVLAAFSLGAYNFHPGSPDYPGTAPEAWAAYEKAPSFGATLHAMTAQVDAGEIIDTEILPAPAIKDRTSYATLAKQALALLFSRTAPSLTGQAPLRSALRREWGGVKRTAADFEKMCRLAPDISNEEFERRLVCFGPPGPVEFSLTLHGMRFVLETPGGIIGHLDPPRPDHLLGWVRDGNAPAVRQEVRITVDGRDFFVMADVYRPDVHAAGFGDGQSGFFWSVPEELRDSRPHRVEVTCKGRPVPGSPKLAVFPRPAAEPAG